MHIFHYLYDRKITATLSSSMTVNKDKAQLYVDDLEDLANGLLKNSDRNQYFEIYCFKDNKPLSFSETTALSVKGDNMYLIPPLRDYHFLKEDRKGALIAFHKDILTYEAKEFSLSIYDFFGRQRSFSTLFIDQENIIPLDTMYKLLKTEHVRNPHNILLLRTILKAFLLKLMDTAQQELISPSINEKRIYRFLLLLEDYYDTEKGVSFYADKLNLSTKRLNQILKQKTGKTINQILQERTLTEAKHLLFVGKKSIKEVAYTLGFHDASYFSRFFKKMTKLNPEEFRSVIKNQVPFRKS